MSETSQNKNSTQALAGKEEDNCLGIIGKLVCKKRDRSASEERLIQAGLEIFSKHGFNGATTKMIAKKADVNESLIGRYFDGKEGLFLFIVKRFIEELVSREIPYPPKDTLTAELEAYVIDRIAMGCDKDKEDFVKMIMSQSLTDKKFRKKAIETLPNMQVDPRLIARVQALAERGKLKPGISVDEICHDIDTYLDGMFFFERILHEAPLERIEARTLKFVRTYAKQFEA